MQLACRHVQGSFPQQPDLEDSHDQLQSEDLQPQYQYEEIYPPEEQPTTERSPSPAPRQVGEEVQAPGSSEDIDMEKELLGALEVMHGWLTAVLASSC